ncbi:MAG: hypothetical protein GXO04_02885 [Aquificae bacterium]|nr:hypothetical protein [Aquificota bacterium]
MEGSEKILSELLEDNVRYLPPSRVYEILESLVDLLRSEGPEFLEEVLFLLRSNPRARSAVEEFFGMRS